MQEFFQNDQNPSKSMQKLILLQKRHAEFKMLFPTERDSTKELQKYGSGGPGTSCKACGNSLVRETDNPRAGVCEQCGEEVWYTADTFFNGIKKPEVWHLTLWLIGQGEKFNAADLTRLTKVAHSTALAIIQKILMLVQEKMPLDASAVEVSTELLLDCVYKRSLKTPADEHPVAEEAEMRRTQDSASGGNGNANQTEQEEAQIEDPLDNLSATEQEIVSILSSTPVHIDEICQKINMSPQEISMPLINLELNCVIERHSSDSYVIASPKIQAQFRRLHSRKNEATSNPLSQQIDAFVDFVRMEFKGISRKYVQLYLAAYWCFKDRAKWTTEELLRMCARAKPITYEQIRAFVSPLKVNMIRS